MQKSIVFLCKINKHLEIKIQNRIVFTITTRTIKPLEINHPVPEVKKFRIHSSVLFSFAPQFAFTFTFIEATIKSRFLLSEVTIDEINRQLRD